MGWDSIEDLRGPLFDGLDEGAYVYYVHSYAPQTNADTIARTTYGETFSAAIRRDNFFGTQFHPEKSASVGERILQELFETMIEVIPAIDLVGGGARPGSRRATTTERRPITKIRPLDAALRYEECGAGRRLHMVDLDGAKASRPANLGVLERITARTSLEVQYGGGIKSTEALRERVRLGGFASDLRKHRRRPAGPAATVADRVRPGADRARGGHPRRPRRRQRLAGSLRNRSRGTDRTVRRQRPAAGNLHRHRQRRHAVGPVGRPVPETARTFSPDRTDRQRRHSVRGTTSKSSTERACRALSSARRFTRAGSASTGLETHYGAAER